MSYDGFEMEKKAIALGSVASVAFWLLVLASVAGSAALGLTVAKSNDQAAGGFAFIFSLPVLIVFAALVTAPLRLLSHLAMCLGQIEKNTALLASEAEHEKLREAAVG